MSATAIRRLLTLALSTAVLTSVGVAGIGGVATAGARSASAHAAKASSAGARSAAQRRRRRCRSGYHRNARGNCVRTRYQATPAAPVSPPTPASPTGAYVALDVPCPDAGLIPDGGNVERVTAATLCLVNQERERNGEVPLATNARLAAAAMHHTQDMVAGGYFAHNTPAGETSLQRVLDTGYVLSDLLGYVIGENLAWGTSQLAAPGQIVIAWMNSPEHRANILNGSYRETGLGIIPAVPANLGHGQAGAMYSQEFGVLTGGQ